MNTHAFFTPQKVSAFLNKGGVPIRLGCKRPSQLPDLVDLIALPKQTLETTQRTDLV